MFQLGGILSTVLLGPMIDRYGAPRVLACSFASGVVFILVVGLYSLPAPYIALPILGAGAAMIEASSRQCDGGGVYTRRGFARPAWAGRSASAASGVSPSGARWRFAGLRIAAQSDFPVRLRSGLDRRLRHPPADRQGGKERRRHHPRDADAGGVRGMPVDR